MKKFKFGRGYIIDADVSFDTVTFPLIRRVFSRLLASEIVSLQPLDPPLGLLTLFGYEYVRTPLKKKFKFGR